MDEAVAKEGPRLFHGVLCKDARSIINHNHLEVRARLIRKPREYCTQCVGTFIGTHDDAGFIDLGHRVSQVLDTRRGCKVSQCASAERSSRFVTNKGNEIMSRILGGKHPK